ncbi:hypothetical protein J2T10_001867 [Paenarthrobacter nicotinovorans]|uniref:Uncharacterized protein n=1 Tax=Paenarthrobacter nicotinovorans TaxID=29320 RepID=A0ABT9TME8_PAENI|nr:hypothetical protein [Paenarthrobacter nicotinovorans]MDQ0102221.1 hypothetical protein [Paenarthrobacter nicotinovorans]GAT87685.1 hypothetical protein CVCC1112_2344 [Paenarthrobacter nicotinovorans]
MGLGHVHLDLAADLNLKDRRRNLLIDHTDKGLAYLDDELSKLMQQVRRLHGVLGPIHTAEQVITANDDQLTQAWKKRGELARAYQDIHSAQKTITSPAIDGQTVAITAVGHIRNSLELSGYWLNQRANSLDVNAARDPLPAVRNFDE